MSWSKLVCAASLAAASAQAGEFRRFRWAGAQGVNALGVSLSNLWRLTLYLLANAAQR